MSEEQLKAFLEKVKGDTNLQEKLKVATDVDAVVAIAKGAGFSFSVIDLTKVKSRIEDEELENAAGGCVFASDAYASMAENAGRALGSLLVGVIEGWEHQDTCWI